jgi:hypothetical protein
VLQEFHVPSPDVLEGEDLRPAVAARGDLLGDAGEYDRAILGMKPR